MGREVKRVPLDFKWPLQKVWEGFLNPHPEPDECSPCEGSGYAPGALVMKKEWFGYIPFDPASTGSTPFTAETPEVLAIARRNCPANSPRLLVMEIVRLLGHFNARWQHHLEQADVEALLKAERLWEFTRSGIYPTAEQVNRWSLTGLGHDAINEVVVIDAKCERLGCESTCPRCQGHGSVFRSAAARKQYESWQRREPPAGEGWQLWETTSEGSPISIVCKSPEELAHWLVRNYASACGSETASYEQWLAMITAGWAPDAVGNGGRIINGVAAAEERSK